MIEELKKENEEDYGELDESITDEELEELIAYDGCDCQSCEADACSCLDMMKQCTFYIVEQFMIHSMTHRCSLC